MIVEKKVDGLTYKFNKSFVDVTDSDMQVLESLEGKHADTIREYVTSIIKGDKIANKETIQMCCRFVKDLKNKDYDFRSEVPDEVIMIIERDIVHEKGQAKDGTPLRGKPFILEPWQIFIVYNIVGFYHSGTKLRRFKEVLVMVCRKNGKTPLISAISWALSMLEYESGSTLYIVGSSLRQAQQAFSFLKTSLDIQGLSPALRIRDNNQEHSIRGEFPSGFIHIEALAANPERQDGLNSNFQIMDELHAYKNATQYNVMKESGKAYRNNMTLGITTAGDNPNSFMYERMKYCQNILSGVAKDEQYFVFIAKADEEENGYVDYTNPVEHIKANPNIGISVMAEDLANDAYQAANDPQQRKDFLAKSLNIYTSALNAYFDINQFRESNRKYKWSIEDLAKLGIDWYGGVDLARAHDLTAAALYGHYRGVDITITHSWFPRVFAHEKAEDDNIPLFGWMDDGWLTMFNNPTLDHNDVMKWFQKMKSMGFRIKQIGVDPRFAREFLIDMKTQGFNVIEQGQQHWIKTEGFKRIERQVYGRKFYYLGSEAYEYCVQNVKAIEMHDDMIKYEKVEERSRIDIFDASVFAAVGMMHDLQGVVNAERWFG